MNRLSLRLWLPLLTGGAIICLFLISIGLSSNRAAAETPPTPIPPFEGVPFQAAVALPEREVVPLRLVEVAAANGGITETFEAPLPPNSLWVSFDADLADGSVYAWGREDVSANVGNGPTITQTGVTTHTGAMWAIGSGEDGGALNPNSDNTPVGIDSWLVYGPIDLVGVSGAEFQFDYWYDGVSGDSFNVAVSTQSGTDPLTFTGLGNTSTGSGSWVTSQYSLTAYAGQQTVYLAFNFVSGSAVTPRKGAFLDNFILRMTPPLNSYLPFVRIDPTPTPTPSPTPVPTPSFDYRDEFNADITGWEDRERDLFESTTNIVSHDSAAYLGVEVRETDDFSIVSPLVQGPAKPYDVESRIRFVTPEDQDEFGIIFGADWNTTQACPDLSQKFATCFNKYYLLSLRWREGGDAGDALEARIVRVDTQKTTNNHPNYTLLQPAIRLDPSKINPNDWNVFKVVVESDNDIKVFINGTEITALKATDSTYLNQRYFGVIVRSPVNDDFTKAQFDYFEVKDN